jgi:hypothetical protein|tara:strand:+ start:691 stop:930 length:240 start_codon:yes stop_codon:yes gene_type:complete
MALEKKVTYDYEVRGIYKTIQQRMRTAIEEDGKEISFSYHRTAFMPDADVSGESDEVKALASSLWTDAVKKAYEDSKAN